MNDQTNSPSRTVGRRTMLGAGAAVVAGTGAILLDGGTAGASGWAGNRDTTDDAAIRQLSINYALGTDSISAGDVPTALDFYHRTFSDDAVITAGFDRTAPALVANGPDAWAAVVENAFQPYSATQHLLGTINVVFDNRRGNSATMTTYLHATHVFKAPDMSLLTVLGTYYDTVQQSRRAWRIVNRFLLFKSFETSKRTAP
jgi:hypothetical protein